MEIITQTPDRLELGYSQSVSRLGQIGATLFGLAFIGFGIWGIFAGQQKTLKCVRLASAQIECEFISSGFINSQTTKLSSLKRAEIITRRSTTRDRRKRNVYSVVLIADDRRIPVSGVSSSNSTSKKADVARLNSFINNPQQFFFKMHEDGRWLGLILGSILASVGVGVIYALWQIKVVSKADFDRHSRLLKVQKSSMYGKLERLEWHLREIEKLSIDESQGGKEIYYSVNIQLNSNKFRNLTLLHTRDRIAAETIATAVEKFL